MKKLLVAMILAACAGTAYADTHFYVDDGGSNSNAGTTTGQPWRTIAFANANVLPANTANGNVWVHVMEGDYQGGGTGAFPNPAIPAEDGKRYFYVGTNLLFPAAAVLPGGTLTKPYVTIKGFKIQGDVTLDSTACRDTVMGNIISGRFSAVGDYSVIDGNTFTTRKRLSLGFRDNDGVLTDGLVFRNNTATELGKDEHGNISQGVLTFGNGQPHATRGASKTDSMIFERNTIGITCNSDLIGFAIVWYYCDDFLSQYNTYNVVWNSTAYADRCIRVRSHSNNVTFNGDAFNVTGQSAASFALSNYNEDTVDGNAFTKNLNMDSTTVIGQRIVTTFMSGMRFARVTYSTFVNQGGDAFYAAESLVGSNLIEHNTFVSGKEHAPYARGLVTFLDADLGADTTKFYSNILYGFAAGTRVNLYGTGTGQSTLSGLSFNSGQGSTAARFAHDWNLYNVWPYRNVPGDRSVAIDGVVGVPTGRSKWGPAWFDRGGPDTTYAAFNITDSPKLGIESFAINMAKDANDAGSLAFVFSPIICLLGADQVPMQIVNWTDACIPVHIQNNASSGDPLIITSLESSDPRVFLAITTISGDSPVPLPITLVPLQGTSAAASCGSVSSTSNLGINNLCLRTNQAYPNDFSSGTITIRTNNPTHEIIIVPWQFIGQ